MEPGSCGVEQGDEKQQAEFGTQGIPPGELCCSGQVGMGLEQPGLVWWEVSAHGSGVGIK